MRWSTAASMIALVSGCAARAQVMGNPARVSTRDTSQWVAETAIAAGQASPFRVIVAWKSSGAADSDVIAWAAAPGGRVFNAPAILPAPPLQTFPTTDPFCGGSADGHVWVGGMQFGPAPSGLCVAHWNPVTGALDLPVVSIIFNEPVAVDKPGFAIGPGLGTGQQNMYSVFVANGYCSSGGRPQVMRRVAIATPSGATGTGSEALLTPGSPNPGCPSTAGGLGANLATLPLGAGSHAGAVIAAYLPEVVQNEHGQPPAVLYSTDYGATWALAATGFPLGQIAQSFGASLATIQPAEGSSIPGTFDFENFPSIAADPAHPGQVYVAFCGRASAGTKSVDVYLARGRFVGEVFTFPVSDVLRITKSMIFESTTEESDQFMPAVTVDGVGGVSILYYTTRNHDTDPDSSVLIQPMVARIPRPPASNLGAYTGAVQIWKLAPASHAWTTPFPRTSSPFVGDYNGAASAGCFSWFSYMSTHEGAYCVYVARLDICGQAADLNANGVIDAADAMPFIGSYGSAQPAADVNHDGSVDAEDVVVFNQCLISGCTPP